MEAEVGGRGGDSNTMTLRSRHSIPSRHPWFRLRPLVVWRLASVYFRPSFRPSPSLRRGKSLPANFVGIRYPLPRPRAEEMRAAADATV